MGGFCWKAIQEFDLDWSRSGVVWVSTMPDVLGLVLSWVKFCVRSYGTAWNQQKGCAIMGRNQNHRDGIALGVSRRNWINVLETVWCFPLYTRLGHDQHGMFPSTFCRLPFSFWCLIGCDGWYFFYRGFTLECSSVGDAWSDLLRLPRSVHGIRQL